MFKSNKNEINKMMKKELKQKQQFLRARREESYDNNVKNWKSEEGSVGSMVGDTHWGYLPTTKSPTRPFKPQRLSESQMLDLELEQIIQELERD